MKLVGITGGIGMGKSTAMEILQRRGQAVVDTDHLARQIVEPGQPALDEIRAAFGPELFGEDGRLRRDLLAARVFSRPDELRKLETILHPRIRQIWEQQAAQWKREGRSGFVVIPLLFETGTQVAFHAVVCLACSAETQLVRLRQRGWSDEEIRKRQAAQWPVEKKILASQHVIWTEGPVAVHEMQWGKILAGLGVA